MLAGQIIKMPTILQRNRKQSLDDLFPGFRHQIIRIHSQIRKTPEQPIGTSAKRLDGCGKELPLELRGLLDGLGSVEDSGFLYFFRDRPDLSSYAPSFSP
jgi:hypothetical protein